VSLYQLLSDLLREAIRRGDYGPLERLPSEHELVREYAISRITADRAAPVLDQQPARGAETDAQRERLRLERAPSVTLRRELLDFVIEVLRPGGARQLHRSCVVTGPNPLEGADNRAAEQVTGFPSLWSVMGITRSSSTILADICATSLLCASKELLAEAISRLRTRAAIVAISPIPSFTTSLESALG
jgi:DNA-binding transcriptional MocR family regulator